MRKLPPVRKTVGELAALVAGEAEGDPSYLIEAASGLLEAGPRDVSFLGNPKYAQAANASKAGCLLLPPSSRGARAQASNRIYVEDPQRAFAQVLALIEAQLPEPAPAIDPRALVHPEARLGPGVGIGPFAVIEAGARIGERTRVEAQCYVGREAEIGRGCRLYPQVVIREACRIGDRVIIHSGTVIGADGFGFTTDKRTGKHTKIPQLGEVVIEDDVEIGANTAIDRATVGSTVVESGTKIDNLVQIGHNVKVGRDCLLVAQAGVAGSCLLGNRVILAGQAGLAGHLRLDDGAIVMAQTGVMSDLEKGQVVFGSPARPHREAFKLQALYGKLPEIYEALRELKEKLRETPASSEEKP